MRTTIVAFLFAALCTALLFSNQGRAHSRGSRCMQAPAHVIHSQPFCSPRK